jgi:hypothetical protein
MVNHHIHQENPIVQITPYIQTLSKAHFLIPHLIKLKFNNMKILSKDQFDLIPDGEVFDSGVLPNSPKGLYMTSNNLGKELRWVAKKGDGYDWAIYCFWAEKPVEWVVKFGDKVTNGVDIRKCVPCDDEVFKLYRY